MEMGHEAARRCHEIYDFICQQIRLYRRNTVALDSVDLVEGTAQINETVGAPFAEIADVDTGYHYFASALGRRLTCLSDKLVYRARTRTSASLWNCAVGAPVVASVLHFQKIACAVAARARGHEFPQRCRIGYFGACACRVSVGEALCDKFGKSELVVDSGHNANPRQRCGFFRFKLRIAACDGDCCIGITAVERAYGAAAFAVGLLGHRACVHYYDVRLFIRSGATDAFVRKHAGDSRSFGEIQFAAECMVKRRALVERVLVSH